MNVLRANTKYKEIKRCSIQNKQQSDRMGSHIRRQNEKLTKINEINNKNLMRSLMTTTGLSLETNSFLKSEFNVRCLLGAFMTETGAEDIGKLMTMIGIGGGGTFEG